MPNQKSLTLIVITILLLLASTGLATAQENWWNTQYQCRAKIENVQPGDNHITPFVDLDYLATLCNMTKANSWAIVQNGKQLPTYSYGPSQEKTIIFTTTPEQNTISQHWGVTNTTGGHGHDKSSKPYKTTNQNNTLTVTTEQKASDWTTYSPQTYVQYTIIKDAYLPKPEQIQSITLVIEHEQPDLTASRTTIQLNGKTVYSVFLNDQTSQKTLRIKLPAKQLKQGNNRITLKIQHINSMQEHIGGATVYQKTTISLNATTKDNQTVTTTPTTAWLYYTDKKLAPGPTYQPIMLPSQKYHPGCTGSYHTGHPSYGQSKTCSIPVTTQNPITRISFSASGKLVDVSITVYAQAKNKTWTTMGGIPSTYLGSGITKTGGTVHLKSPTQNPNEHIQKNQRIIIRVCITGQGRWSEQADISGTTAWYEYVPSNPTQVTSVEEYTAAPTASANQVFQPIKGHNKQKTQQNKGNINPLVPITSMAAAAYAYHLLTRRKQEQINQTIQKLVRNFQQTVQNKSLQGQQVSDEDYTRFWEQVRALKRAFSYWKKWLAPVPEWLYQKMKAKTKNIFYQPDYIKHRLEHPDKYGKPYAGLIKPDGTPNTASIQQTLKEIQNTTYSTPSSQPTKPHWPTKIRTPKKEYLILTKITPNTTQILIQDTKTGEYYTLPIQTHPKTKSIQYNWKNKKKYKPKYKIILTLPDGSTIKHNNTRALQQYLTQEITPTNKIKNYTQTPGTLTITLQNGTTITLTKPSKAFLEWLKKILQYPSKYQNHPYNQLTTYIKTAQWTRAAQTLARHWQEQEKPTDMTTQEISQRLQLLTQTNPQTIKQIWNQPNKLKQLTQKAWQQKQTRKEEIEKELENIEYPLTIEEIIEYTQTSLKEKHKIPVIEPKITFIKQTKEAVILPYIWRINTEVPFPQIEWKITGWTNPNTKEAQETLEIINAFQDKELTLLITANLIHKYKTNEALDAIPLIDYSWLKTTFNKKEILQAIKEAKEAKPAIDEYKNNENWSIFSFIPNTMPYLTKQLPQEIAGNPTFQGLEYLNEVLQNDQEALEELITLEIQSIICYGTTKALSKTLKTKTATKITNNIKSRIPYTTRYVLAKSKNGYILRLGWHNPKTQHGFGWKHIIAKHWNNGLEKVFKTQNQLKQAIIKTVDKGTIYKSDKNPKGLPYKIYRIRINKEKWLNVVVNPEKKEIITAYISEKG